MTRRLVAGTSRRASTTRRALAEVSARRREDVVDAYDFAYASVRESGARHCERGAAAACWLRIFGGAEGGDARARATVLAFIEYVDGRSDVRYITADVWSQARHFVRCALEFGGDLSWYDEQEAWPTLLDEFAELAKKKMASSEASSGRMDVASEHWTTRSATPNAVSMAFDGMMIASASARSGDSRSARRRTDGDGRGRRLRQRQRALARIRARARRGTRAQARVLAGGRSRRRAVSSTYSSPCLLSLFARASTVHYKQFRNGLSPRRARHAFALTRRASLPPRVDARLRLLRLWDKSRSPT